MDQSKLAWNLMKESVGRFEGRGVNHEGQDFTGKLSLEMAVPEKALELISSATGDDGEVYHSEKSWIGFDLTGTLNLYVASSNHPAITPHVFHRIEEKADQKTIIFRFGNPEDKQSFREEVNLSFFTDGSVVHHYSWGLPGGEFEPRSGSKMKRI